MILYNTMETDTELNKKNKTTWNIPRNDLNANSVENFQIMNMNYKIKKAKDKKKRIENYKQIPLFETLSNDISGRGEVNDTEYVSSGEAVKYAEPVINHTIMPTIIAPASSTLNKRTNKIKTFMRDVDASSNTVKSRKSNVAADIKEFISPAIDAANYAVDKFDDFIDLFPTINKPFGSSNLERAGSEGVGERVNSVDGSRRSLFANNKPPNLSVEPFGATKDDYICGTPGAPCAKDPSKESLTDIIERLYRRAIALNRELAKKIINGISITPIIDDEQQENTDVTRLAHYIAMLEGVSFSSIVVYNWFYLIFYAEQIDKVHPYEFSRKSIKQYIDDNSETQKFATGIASFILFFIEYAIYFPEMIDYFALKIAPKSTSVFNITTCFILLFFIILYISIYFTYEIKNITNDTLSGAKNNITRIMGAIVAIAFGVDVMNYQKQEAEKASGNIISMITNVMNSSSAFNYVRLFLYFLVRFIVIMVVSVPLGAILSVLYLFSYSIFGIFIYKGFNYTTTVTKIQEHISDSIRNSNPPPPTCEPISWWRQIIKIFTDIFGLIADFFFLKMFFITYISVLAYAGYDLYKNASTAKSGLLDFEFNIAIFLIVLIFTILLIGLNYIFNGVIARIYGATSMLTIVKEKFFKLFKKDKPIMSSSINSNNTQDDVLKAMAADVESSGQLPLPMPPQLLPHLPAPPPPPN